LVREQDGFLAQTRGNRFAFFSEGLDIVFVLSHLFFCLGNDFLASLDNDHTVLGLESGFLDDKVITTSDITPLLDTSDQNSEIALYSVSITVLN